MFYKRMIQYKSVISNLSYLTILQLFNLVLPLISYPYLIRTIGNEGWGMLIYTQTITGYLAVIVNFGFNVTGTREISINSDNLIERNRVATTIYFTKGILFLVSLLSIFVTLLLTSSNALQYKLFFLSSWNVLYEFAIPIWFFQGLNKMKYITIINVITKSLVTLSVFIFIDKSSTLVVYPLLNTLFTLLSILLCFFILKKEKFKIEQTNYGEINKLIKESYTMALAYTSNAFKSNFNVVVLKFLLSFKEVAYFDLAQKVLSIITNFLDLISQSIYPTMVKNKNINFLKKVMFFSTFFALTLTIGTFLFSSQIVNILGGSEMLRSKTIIDILSLNYLPYILGALLGRNCLLVFKEDIVVLKSMFYSSVIYLVLVGCVAHFIHKNALEMISFCLVASFIYELVYRYIKSRKYLLLK